jgi:hypothetical protein
MLLGNLLEERGFDSLNQLLQAYRGKLTTPARTRRVFLSFHAEDANQVRGFRLMAHNPRLQIDFADESLAAPIDSQRGGYIRQVLREKIRRAGVTVCLIGDGTAWRDWVDWELETALELHKGLCGVRLKGSHGRAPDILRAIRAPVAQWDLDQMIAAIECAAAKRS